MAAIVWRDVNAPQFGDALQGFRAGGEAFNQAFTNARNAMQGFRDFQIDENSRMAMSDLMSYDNADKLRGDYANGILNGRSYNPRNLSAAAIAAIGGRAQDLQNYTLGEVNLDRAGVLRDQARSDLDRSRSTNNLTINQSEQATADLQASVRARDLFARMSQLTNTSPAGINKFLDETPDAREIIAALPIEQQQAFLVSPIEFSRGRLTNEQTGAQIGQTRAATDQIVETTQGAAQNRRQQAELFARDSQQYKDIQAAVGDTTTVLLNQMTTGEAIQYIEGEMNAGRMSRSVAARVIANLQSSRPGMTADPTSGLESYGAEIPGTANPAPNGSNGSTTPTPTPAPAPAPAPAPVAPALPGQFPRFNSGESLGRQFGNSFGSRPVNYSEPNQENTSIYTAAANASPEQLARMGREYGLSPEQMSQVQNAAREQGYGDAPLAGGTSGSDTPARMINAAVTNFGSPTGFERGQVPASMFNPAQMPQTSGAGGYELVRASAQRGNGTAARGSRGSRPRMPNTTPATRDYSRVPFTQVKEHIIGQESRAQGGYNALAYNTNGGTRNAAGVRPPRPVTSMTLGQLTDWQNTGMRGNTRNFRYQGDPGSTGVGAYQFERSTLIRVAKAALGDNWRNHQFTPQMQDRLAEHLYNSVRGSRTALPVTWAVFAGNGPSGRGSGNTRMTSASPMNGPVQPASSNRATMQPISTNSFDQGINDLNRAGQFNQSQNQTPTNSPADQLLAQRVAQLENGNNQNQGNNVPIAPIRANVDNAGSDQNNGSVRGRNIPSTNVAALIAQLEEEASRRGNPRAMA